MPVDEMAGAYLRDDETFEGTLIERQLSESSEKLFEIRRVSTGFRVTTLTKRSGAPQFIGWWWTPDDHGFGTATLDEAREFVSEMIHN